MPREHRLVALESELADLRTKNAALDKLMEMDGQEEVKREFLKLHALVSVGTQQGGSHIGER